MTVDKRFLILGPELIERDFECLLGALTACRFMTDIRWPYTPRPEAVLFSDGNADVSVAVKSRAEVYVSGPAEAIQKIREAYLG